MANACCKFVPDASCSALPKPTWLRPVCSCAPGSQSSCIQQALRRQGASLDGWRLQACRVLPLQADTEGGTDMPLAHGSHAAAAAAERHRRGLESALRAHCGHVCHSPEVCEDQHRSGKALLVPQHMLPCLHVARESAQGNSVRVQMSRHPASWQHSTYTFRLALCEPGMGRRF